MFVLFAERRATQSELAQVLHASGECEGSRVDCGRFGVLSTQATQGQQRDVLVVKLFKLIVVFTHLFVRQSPSSTTTTTTTTASTNARQQSTTAAATKAATLNAQVRSE